MLKTFRVQGFKSLKSVDGLELAPLTVFFGPNAAGKSNLLDAFLLLSRLATSQTLADTITKPVRGLPLELFAFPPGGLPDLVKQGTARFSLEAEIQPPSSNDRLRYRCEIAIKPASGSLSVEDEYLAKLTSKGNPRGNPAIEKKDDILFVRRKSKPAHPWQEAVGLNHTLLSNHRYSGREYATIENTRNERSSYRSYYLDPRVAMRYSQAPRAVDDIGPLGEYMAPFLHRLKAENTRIFHAVRRTLCTLIPSVKDLIIELDERRGIVNIEIVQNGTPFSARVVSEGTLRVLALVSVTMNPWGGSLVAFEEPENGVHPRRLELITDLFKWMAFGEGNVHQNQVILTTHSPAFCASLVRLSQEHPEQIKMYRTVRRGVHTAFEPFSTTGPLLADAEIRAVLTGQEEDGVFEGLMLRGLLDG